MKYYKISEDKRIHNRVVFRDFKTNETAEFHTEDADTVNDSTVLYTEENENCVYPEIIEAPLFMVSDELSKVLLMYQPSIILKTVVFFDKVKNTQKRYKLPLLERVECLYEGELTPEQEKAALLDFPKKKYFLHKDKIKHKKIFKIKGIPEMDVIVSMDVAESLIRRGVYGVRFQEVTLI